MVRLFRKRKALGLAALMLLLGSVHALAGGNELAYFKIPSLTTLGASSVAAGDFIAVYDVSADKTKKVDATTVAGLGSGATVAEINRIAKVSTRAVTLSVTGALDEPTHEGKLLLLNGSGAARTFTLPASTGSGATYRFMVAATNTSNYIIVRAGSDVLKGGIIMSSDNASNGLVGFESTSATTLTFNATTTGMAAIGDTVILTDCAAATWCVNGRVTESGSEATPFS